jgi:hypothetical protein
MALKDLPGSTVVDVKILLDGLRNYIIAAAQTSAGPRSAASAPPLPIRREKNARWINQGVGTAPPSVNKQLTDSMTAIYNTLKGSITVQASDLATLTATGVSTKAGWDNGFFVIRTQVLGADATIIAQLDEFWTRLQAVKGRWNWKLSTGK